MKFSLVCGILLCVSGVVAADEVYVPDNNPASGAFNAIPFYAEWTSINGQVRYQLMFSPSELGNRSFQIDEIGFAAGYTGGFTATQLQVRLSHSTVGTLNPTMDLNIPSPIECYTGPIALQTTLDTFSDLGLKRSFAYNGRDFLVVDLRYMGGKTTLAGPYRYPGTFRSGPVYRSWAYNNYNAVTESGQDRLAGLKTRLKVDSGKRFATIAGVGLSRPGGTMNLTLASPSDGGLPYQAASALGTGPIPIDTRTLLLSNDPILQLSVLGLLPSVFVNYSGLLNGQGDGLAKIDIINDPALIGVQLHSAFVTLDPQAPSGIKSISNTFSFPITK